jgi:hypothetical protein
MTTASSAGSVDFRDNPLLKVLCGLFLAAWIASAIHPITEVPRAHRRR